MKYEDRGSDGSNVLGFNIAVAAAMELARIERYRRIQEAESWPALYHPTLKFGSNG